MRVTVVFYAGLADLTGRREWAVDLPAGAKVRDVWDQCVRTYADLARMSGRVSAAIDDDFASLDTSIDDGDEIGFLPPVSGGAGRSR
jgi:molybdopterin synthase catalytic subunit